MHLFHKTVFISPLRLRPRYAAFKRKKNAYVMVEHPHENQAADLLLWWFFLNKRKVFFLSLFYWQKYQRRSYSFCIQFGGALYPALPSASAEDWLKVTEGENVWTFEKNIDTSLFSSFSHIYIICVSHAALAAHTVQERCHTDVLIIWTPKVTPTELVNEYDKDSCRTFFWQWSNHLSAAFQIQRVDSTPLTCSHKLISTTDS